MLAAAATPAAWLLVCVTVAGAGIATVSTTGTVLLVRSVRDDVLARVLGVLGTVRAAAMTTGSLAAPLLVHLVGVRWTLVAVGTATPLAALATQKGLRRIDDASFVPEHELRLLRTSPVFAPILPVALERLASRLEPVTVPAGTSVVQEGDQGDRVYLVAGGRLDVTAGGVSKGADAHAPGAQAAGQGPTRESRGPLPPNAKIGSRPHRRRPRHATVSRWWARSMATGS
jgi:MFS family permease